MPKRSPYLAPLFAALLILAGCSSSTADTTLDGVVAFENVNVIPMDHERVLENYTVLVRDGRIADIGPDVEIPRGATRIDGTGRYLLPGFIDMAVYGLSDDDHLPFMLHGVTTYRHARGATLQLKWREDAQQGDMIGPYVYNTRNMVDNGVTNLGPVVPMASPEEADKIIKQHTDNGYDAIRITYGLQRDSYFALAEAAEQAGIPLMGNIPKNVRLDEVSDRTILGLGRLVKELQPSDTLFDDVNITFGIPPYAYWTMDESRLEAVVQTVKQQNLRVVPMNFSTYWGHVPRDEFEAMLADPTIAYHRPDNVYYWKDWYERRVNPGSIRASENAREINKRITDALHEAGVTLLMGTRGASGILVLAGEGVEEELAFFVESGLTPYEALQTGTYHAAQELEALDEIGTIAVGKQADLVLLSANPLEDIRNVAAVEGVMGDGRWYTRTVMLEELEATRALYDREGHFMSILEDEGYKAAREHYLTFRQENPDLPLFREMRLLNYIYALVGAQQRYEEALGVLDMWEEAVPNSWLALGLYGYVYENMGDYDKAIEAHEHAWAANPYYWNFSVKEEAEKVRKLQTDES